MAEIPDYDDYYELKESIKRISTILEAVVLALPIDKKYVVGDAVFDSLDDAEFYVNQLVDNFWSNQPASATGFYNPPQIKVYPANLDFE